ncbi:CpsD/CapB family tyrosine-protein kinase [Bacillus sp. V3B]|uniref:CpsD/CapB family tyrosine-protein kinase n=1 Tax=Bacillus sp. V3B TaxID=2804915 RepID=UPI00210CFC9D|nr:CpsD/CapB family tyrosine-protein kinase [Bacillus sp. V3B]MCQ6275273.1 CpsD/CapB family tyrosine-protein kinase [Bacillus sp. V3B]
MKLFSPAKKRNLITYSFPESKIAEEFRIVRTNVRIVTNEQKHKTLVITSPNPGEGKSTVAANLAVSMAQQKEKILLIDANLRRPSSHFIFKLPNSVGLTDVLIGRSSFEEAVLHTEIGRLDVLTSGEIPNNPAELLSSRVMKDLLQKVVKQYEMVLIDSSSILEVTDTKILTSQCDEVLLVCHKGETTIERAAEAKKVLEFAKANISGVIMNEM